MKYIIYNEIIFDNDNLIEYKVKTVHDNFIEIKDSNNLVGIADLNGKVLIKPVFSRVVEFDDYYLTSKGYKKGLLDKNGYEILEPKYKEIYTFKNKRAIVRNENNFYGIIDDNGKELVEPKYYYIQRSDNSFIVSVGNIECIIDIDGNIIIDNKKYHYDFLGNNLYKYYKNYSEKSGILSKDKFLTKDKYDDIKYLNDDRFLVNKGNFFKYIIDKNGKKILTLPYMDTYVYPESDIIVIQNTNKDCIELVTDGGKNYVTLPQVKYVREFHFNIAIALMKNDRYTLINNKGEEIIDKDYYYILYDDRKNRFIIYNDRDDVEEYLYEDQGIVSADEVDTSCINKEEWIDYSRYKSVEKITDEFVIAQDDLNTYFISKDGIKNKLDGLYKVIDKNDNYVVLSYHWNRSLYYMVCNLKGEIIIPLLNKKIFLLSNKTLIIDNHIINLNCEYLNFNYKYKVDINYDNIYNELSFDTKLKCEEYINKVKSWYQEKEKKEKELDDYLEKISMMSYEDYIEDEENKKMIKSLERWL